MSIIRSRAALFACLHGTYARVCAISPRFASTSLRLPSRPLPHLRRPIAMGRYIDPAVDPLRRARSQLLAFGITLIPMIVLRRSPALSGVEGSFVLLARWHARPKHRQDADRYDRTDRQREQSNLEVAKHQAGGRHSAAANLPVRAA